VADVEGYLLDKKWPFKRAGNNEIHGPCFFCNEDQSSRGRLYINVDPSGDPPGLFTCFLCDERGALNKLRKHFGDPVLKEDSQIENSYRVSQVLQSAAEHYYESLAENEFAYDYLKDERGLTFETIESHKLGYSDGKSLIPLLFKQGFTKEEVIASGMMDQYGREFLAGCIAIPYLSFGKVLQIRGRKLDNSKNKYLTPTGHKAKLFNADRVATSTEVVVAAGEFDAMVLEQYGFDAVGVPGELSWQDGWNDYLSSASRVYVCLDADETGARGAEKISISIGARAKIVKMPPDDDDGTKNDPTEWLIGKQHSADDFKMLLIKARGGILLSVDEAWDEWEEDRFTGGLKLGIESIDSRIQPGLKPGQVAVMLAKTNVGKGHPLDTDVPTPNGIRKWGDLEVGDYVFGSNGHPTRITDVFDRGVLQTYRVTFSDRTSTIVDGDHIWTVLERYGRERKWIKSSNYSTKDLMSKNLHAGYKNREYRYKIPMCSPVQYDHKDLPVDPYTLGALISNGYLAGGSVALTTPDPEVAARVREVYTVVKINRKGDVCDAYTIHNLISTIRGMGLNVKSGLKFIPEEYFVSSVEQRVALLQGLMDGDGSSRQNQNRKSCNYYSSSRQLLKDMIRLVTSLGGTAMESWIQRNEDVVPEGQLSIMLPDEIKAFSSIRKNIEPTVINKTTPMRAIVSIKPEGESEIRCISVDSEDSLYLIEKSHIVTHNTIMILNIFHRLLMSDPSKKILFVSLEQTRAEWFERARRIYRFYNPQASDRDCLDFFRDRLLIIDKNRVTPDEFINCVEQYEFELGAKPDFVGVDYLGYWARSFKGEGYERTGAAIMEMKAIAKDLKLTIFTPHQVNRGTKFGEEIEADSARDAGTVEETADFVFSLFSDDNIKGRQEDEKTGEVKMRILKSRHGGKNALTSFQFAPLSLAMIPQGDPLVLRAKDELKMEQQRDNFETAIYRHATGDRRIIVPDDDLFNWQAELGLGE